MVEFSGHDVTAVLVEVAGLFISSVTWIAHRLGKLRQEITNVRYILVGAPESKEQSVLSRLARIERQASNTRAHV